MAPPPSGGPFYPNHHDSSLDSSYKQSYYGTDSSATVSWSGSNPQMASADTLVRLPQTGVIPPPPHPYYVNGIVGQPGVPPPPHLSPPSSQHEFNPWNGLFIPTATMGPPSSDNYNLHPNFSPRYPPTTLSTITERSTPGTLGDAKLSLGGSPASFPSADLQGYYTPPQGSEAAVRLSYASEGSSVNGTTPTAAAGAVGYQNQHIHLYHDNNMGQVWSTTTTPKSNKMMNERKKNGMVAVNRTEDEGQGSRPPRYSRR